MIIRRVVTRRATLKGIGATAAATGIGFPRILKAQDRVKIGFLSALTGVETIIGETQLNCFKLAVDNINAAGGAGGREVEFVVEDDQTSTKGTIEKARKLIYQDNVDCIIGLVTSLEHVAARSVTNPAKKILIYNTFYEGGVCEKYFIATGQVPNQQIDPFVSWLTENIGKTVYVIGSDYVWPRESTKEIQAAFEAKGGALAGAEFFPFGTQDFGPAFAKVNNAKPDMVWVMLAGADGVTGLKQYRSFGMKPQLVGNLLDEVYSFAHPELAAGAIASQAYFMTVDSPMNKKFVAAYQAKYGADKPINVIGESAYDAVWLYALAVAKAGTTDADSVLQALPMVEFDAPQGRVSISSKNQHMVSNSIIGRARDDGLWDILRHNGQVEPDIPGCKLG